jgi:hypothetical protein
VVSCNTTGLSRLFVALSERTASAEQSIQRTDEAFGVGEGLVQHDSERARAEGTADDYTSRQDCLVLFNPVETARKPRDAQVGGLAVRARFARVLASPAVPERPAPFSPAEAGWSNSDGWD